MQKRVVGCLAAGAALGAARFADLALWTDRDTGLVTAGWVGWRYLALFAFVAAVLLVSWRGSWQAGPVVRPGGRVPAGALDVSAALAALCMLEQAVGSFVQAERGASLVRGALAVVCALWLAALDWYWLTNRRESPAAPPPWMAWLGVAGSLVFVWDILRSFMTNGSSWHRVAQTAAVWQQLAALLLLSALLRAVCLPGEPNPRAVGRYGLLAFGLCLCWQLPQCILLPGGPGDWALCALGLLGGLCAVLCAGPGLEKRGSHAAD